jgi:nucleoside 2-deoxyribosyltransferase
VISVYLATRWSNPKHTELLEALRALGIKALDFKGSGVTDEEVFGNLDGPADWIVRMRDMNGAAYISYVRTVSLIREADITILVQPAGASAHWELGYAQGIGKRTAVLLDGNNFKSELMYRDALLYYEQDKLLDMLDIANKASNFDFSRWEISEV